MPPPKKQVPSYMTRRLPTTSGESNSSVNSNKLPLKRKGKDIPEIVSDPRASKSFLSESAKKSIDSANNVDEDDDADKDDDMDLPISRIEDPRTNTPKFTSMNIDLTGSFHSPLTGRSSSTSTASVSTTSTKGSGQSVTLIGKSCKHEDLTVGENANVAVNSMPGFQGHFRGMRCKSYKIVVSDLNIEAVLDKYTDLLIKVLLVELAKDPRAFALNSRVKCLFVIY